MSDIDKGLSDKASDKAIRSGPRKFRSREEFAVAREKVESGKTLQAVSKETGIPYTTLQQRAALECWAIANPVKRSTGRARVTYTERVKEVKAKLAQEEELLKAEAALVRIESVEVLARGGLGKYSERLKLKLARVLDRTVDELEGLEPKQRAQAAAALSLVSERLYKWSREESEQERERAADGMVNLRLINTPPWRLKEMAEEKRKTRELEERLRNEVGEEASVKWEQVGERCVETEEQVEQVAPPAAEVTYPASGVGGERRAAGEGEKKMEGMRKAARRESWEKW
jgi:hypothetical protein